MRLSQNVISVIKFYDPASLVARYAEGARRLGKRVIAHALILAWPAAGLAPRPLRPVAAHQALGHSCSRNTAGARRGGYGRIVNPLPGAGLSAAHSPDRQRLERDIVPEPVYTAGICQMIRRSKGCH